MSGSSSSERHVRVIPVYRPQIDVDRFAEAIIGLARHLREKSDVQIPHEGTPSGNMDQMA
jgi:hypothetical protein